jgi:hypothetical protein
MPQTIRSITAAAICIAVAATITACGTSDPEPEVTDTPTASASAEPTVGPTEPATPEVDIPTEAGAVVTADLIEATRAAGVAVYVSPTGDGNGIVVDPAGTLPEQLVAEVEFVQGIPTSAAHFSAQLGSLNDILTAHDTAGLKVIAIFAMANVSATSAEVIGYAAAGTKATGGYQGSGKSKDEVLSAAQTYADANPGTTVIDLTD